MNRILFFLLWWIVTAPVLGDDPTKEQLEFFEKKIRPTLNDHCFECHSNQKQESDLRLDSRESIIKGGASGPAVDLEDPQASLILKVLNYGGDVEMPPDQKLDDEIIDHFKSWIEMDLPWPVAKAKTTELSMEQRIAQHRNHHWAYQKVTRPRTSKTVTDIWSQNPIDPLILKKLKRHQLSPSPEADRYTLTKRLYRTLLGIPPTFAEIERIQSNPAANWYEKVVEQLLASPRFGERWGRHWMDVARYADTKGYSFQSSRKYPHAYTYRDYVIHSFNADKSYNRFIEEQLAADQLDLGNDSSSLAALGFLTVGRKFNNIHDDVDDKIDVVFRGLQGLTVACARCHNHKYDAIPTADYYSLYGVFISTREGELPYIGSKQEVESYQKQKTVLLGLQKEIEQFLRQSTNKIRDTARANTGLYFAKILSGDHSDDFSEFKTRGQYAININPKIERAWREYIRRQAKNDHPTWTPWKKLSSLENDKNFAKKAKELIQRWESQAPIINPLLLNELKINPPQTRIDLARIYGNLFSQVYTAWKEAGANDSGLAKLPEPQRQLGIALFTDRTPTMITTKSVTAYLSESAKNKQASLKKNITEYQKTLPPELDRAMVVTDIPNPVQPVIFIRGQSGRKGKKVPRQFLEILSQKRKPFSNGAGRLELAKHLTRPSNPLTARVIANRVWMHLMGQSLVITPSDFGQRCPQPVQHDVLDLLASELIENDWSIKSIVRQIVLSATFRQTSKSRKTAAQIDSSNSLYWKGNRQRLEFEALRDSMLFVSGELDLAMGGKSVEITKRPYQKRRAVYGYIDRQDLPNLFRAFDFASPDQSSARRTQTIVPQQMLFLMNSPFVLDRAQQIAHRVSQESTPEAIGKSLYRIIFARDPTPTELDISIQFLKRDPKETQQASNLAQLLLLTNEFSFTD
ncbi:MAG: PSD1 and planctomycete cytochrome C domain-containing protein [Planctomycetota bacterium]|nr:PSD1 and planctomycete cytochrome C domain-containing protein [Planctomycetota bacterium]